MGGLAGAGGSGLTTCRGESAGVGTGSGTGEPVALGAGRGGISLLLPNQTNLWSKCSWEICGTRAGKSSSRGFPWACAKEGIG